MNADWQARYEAAIAATQQAGRFALEHFDTGVAVEWKQDKSPVTLADRGAEGLLRSTLLGQFPQDGFLGEESGDTPGQSGFRWIIDPIDGTRSFVRGVPIWATLVGLEFKGEQIAGVCYLPAMNQVYRALRGDGAFRNDLPIRVSKVDTLKEAHLFYSSVSWFLKAGCEKEFLSLVKQTQRQRGFGDFYGFVLVAQGSGEIMIEHGVHPWDLAALKPIVEEAGGRMTDWTGTPGIHRPDVLATNSRLHDVALQSLRAPATKMNMKPPMGTTTLASATPRTIQWIGGSDGFVRLLDQTLLPTRLEYRDCHKVEEIWEAIRSLRVRGAPAIGIAAAMGVVLGVRHAAGSFGKTLHEVTAYLRTSRPTAVNLFWALERMERKVQTRLETEPPARLIETLLHEAVAIEEEDRQMCRAIGRIGAALIQEGQGVLTHCNAGGLATADYGTALAVLFAAAEQGRSFQVFADETRPLLQGARLTTWELQQRGIDVTLICDSMAAQVMKEGRVQVVITGADRIAANGDTANKIGTYGVALLAHAHNIPFYVAAPSSTFDLSLASGDTIPIEQRDAREVTHGLGKQIAPDGIKVYNPAFDVTPASYIAGIVTERGLIRPVTPDTIRAVLKM